MPVKRVLGSFGLSMQGGDIYHVHVRTVIRRGIASGMGVHEWRDGLQQGKP